MISQVSAIANAILWSFVYFLYRGTVHVYTMLDSMTAALENLQDKLLEHEVENGCPIERSAAARGLSQEELNRVLEFAKEISTKEFVEAILAATAILVAIVGFGTLAVLSLGKTYGWF